ncbi:MAG TPA: tetratricopeptide repeat protein, partial [Adhaeribacter sp.]|nr:tetratricopeptide repeat protein [Adhaeribacter sp.]
MFQFRIFLLAFLLLFTAAGTPSLAQDSDSKQAKKERKAKKRQEKREKKLRKKQKGQPRVITRDLTEKQLEIAEGLFLDGVKFAMLEDYPKALEAFKQAHQINPGNAAINFKIAEMYLQIRREADALPYAKSALELDKTNPYYYLMLAQLHAGKQEFTEAANVFTRLIAQFPDNQSYYVNLAELYLAQNKPTEAIAILEKAEKRFGEMDELIFKKQQLYLKQNNLEKALQEGQKLINANPTESRFVLAQAQILAAYNRPDEAINLLNALIRNNPVGDANAHLLLSDLYRYKKQPAEAERELKLAFAEPSLDVDTKVRILIDYIRQFPNPELEKTAVELAALVVKAHPTEAKSYAVSGDIQAMTGMKKEARDNYAKALRLDRSHFQVWQQLIILDAELGQNDSLLVHTERATDLFPNQAIMWFYNGTAYLIQKNYSKAVKALEFGKKLAQDTPELLLQFNVQLGDAYNSLKQYEKSNNAYEAALAIDPNNAHVLNNYSYFLSVRNSNLPKAREMAEKLIALAPEESTYLDTYAWVLYKQKEYENARKYLEKALETSKDG